MSDLPVASEAGDVLDQDDLDREHVPCPDWGFTVIIQEMTASERDEFESRMIDAKRTNTTVTNPDGETVDVNMQNTRARLVARCAVDEEGNKLFDEPSQVKELGEKSARTLDKLYETAQELNGMTDDDIEELEGNLEGTPQSDTG